VVIYNIEENAEMVDSIIGHEVQVVAPEIKRRPKIKKTDN
jgi:hypothetical protein